jgi:chromosome partitioning protein
MIVAAFNPKGGVGKTTTAVNVAALLAGMGRSVVLVDLEADMNASISLGVRPGDASPSISDALLHHRRSVAPVRPVKGVPNLHLITGDPALAQIESALRHVRQPEQRLADVVRPLVNRFDTVVLDAPAGFGVLAQGVLLAADHCIVPVRAEYLSLESLAHFLRWYRDRRGTRKGIAQLAGILLTRVDYRRQATREIVDILRAHNRRGVFRAEIASDPRAAEAPSHGAPLVTYAASSPAARAYRRFTREFLQRIAHPAS